MTQTGAQAHNRRPSAGRPPDDDRPLPQGQHAELVAPGHDERGQETYVGELEQALLGGYPLARGLVEPRVRAAAAADARDGAVEREEQRRVRRVVVRVIVIVVAGRAVRRGRAVLHRARCTAGCGGPRRAGVAAAAAVGDGGWRRCRGDRVPQSSAGGGGGQRGAPRRRRR